MTDELARVKRIGSTPASRRALYEEALEQDRAMRQTITELRAQNTELLAALRDCKTEGEARWVATAAWQRLERINAIVDAALAKAEP